MENDDVPRIDEEYYTKGNLEAGFDGVFRQNNKLFNEVKSGTWSQKFDTPFINYKVGAVDGERFVQWEQKNINEIKEFCKERREFYAKHGTANPFFAGTAHMMQLPKAIAHEIEGRWFNNRPWELIKRDREDKILFYAIVNEYYSDFVCHPSGKIPIPYNPAIPTR